MPPRKREEYVRPKEAAAGNHRGEPFVLNPNLIYVADDDLVRSYPDLFQPLEVTQQRPEVESMTAAPGELRGP